MGAERQIEPLTQEVKSLKGELEGKNKQLDDSAWEIERLRQELAAKDKELKGVDKLKADIIDLQKKYDA